MTQVTNLFPDPHPNSIAHWSRFNSTPDDFEFRMTADSSGYYIRRISDKKGIGVTRTLILPAGEYVLGLFVNAPYPNNDHVMIVKNPESGAYVCEVRVSQRDQYIAKRFTMPAGRAEILITPPEIISQAINIKTMLLVPAADWSHMYEEDMHWFAPSKSAATSQAVLPDLLTGGLTLILLAAIHTLMWRQWHERLDTQSGAGSGGYQTAQPVADVVCGRCLYIHSWQIAVFESDQRGESHPDRRRASRSARIGYAGATRRQRAGVVDTAALTDHWQPVSARRKHNHQRQCTLAGSQWRHRAGAYPRICMVHDGRLAARAGCMGCRRSERSVMGCSVHSNRGGSRPAAVHPLITPSSLEVAA